MQRFLPLAGLCLAVFLAMTGMGMAGVALPGKYLHASGTMRSAGWLAAIFALSSMLCQYPAGRLADRLGYHRILAAGFLLMAASAAVYGMAGATWAIYAGRFLQGAGEAPVWACAPALLGRLYPGMRGRAMGFYNAAFHVGLLLGPVMGSRAMAGLGSDPFACFAWLCLGAMLLALVTVGHGKSLQTTQPVPAAALLPMLSRLWPMACGLPLLGAVYGLLTSSLPVHLTMQAGFSQKDLGDFLFWTYSGIAVSQGLAGRLSDQYGRAPFMIAGLMGVGGGLWGVLWAAKPLFLPAAALLGLGLGAFAVASMAQVNEASPDTAQGTASGLYYLVWGSGYFAGPLLVNGLGLEAGVTAVASGACCAALCIAVRAMGCKQP